MRLMEPLMAGLIKKDAETNILKLKHILENQ